MKKVLVIFLALLFLALAFWLLAPDAASTPIRRLAEPRQTEALVLNGHRVRVEVVSAGEDVTRGLGGRDALPPDAGMLFELGIGKHAFWMKDMRFPIDILWIRDHRVVEIAANMPPPKTSWEIPATHVPQVESDSVLEINAGMAKEWGIEVGTRVDAP